MGPCDSVSTLGLRGDVSRKGSAAIFQLWCSVNWVSGLDIFRVVFANSTSIRVPHLEGIRNALDVPPPVINLLQLGLWLRYFPK